MTAVADVLMPRLSDSMEEGTILRWIKAVGDEVAVGDELVEIETDKANIVFEATSAGTLVEIVAAVGETRPIGEPIARVGDPSAVVADDDPEPAPARNGRVKASPVARRIAKAHGIDLATVAGSGPGGRVVKADLEAVLSPADDSSPTPVPPPAAQPSAVAAAAPTAGETVTLNRLQQTVARRMVESTTTVPHFHIQTEIDMTQAVAARGRLKAAAAEGDVVPSINDLVVKACAIALREHPRANGSYADGSWKLNRRVNVGVAIAAPGALVVPTIFDADTKGLRTIAAETRALAASVRAGQIKPADLEGGTFTVSNLGMLGVTSFDPVINVPQAAILAAGAIVPSPALRDGELVERQRMSVTLACDHRILYGADGAEFLALVRQLLEEPLALAL